MRHTGGTTQLASSRPWEVQRRSGDGQRGATPAVRPLVLRLFTTVPAEDVVLRALADAVDAVLHPEDELVPVDAALQLVHDLLRDAQVDLAVGAQDVAVLEGQTPGELLQTGGAGQEEVLPRQDALDDLPASVLAVAELLGHVITLP